jgi:hypothetical protein
MESCQVGWDEGRQKANQGSMGCHVTHGHDNSHCHHITCQAQQVEGRRENRPGMQTRADAALHAACMAQACLHLLPGPSPPGPRPAPGSPCRH